MTESNVPVGEFIESLNGYDELAIAKQFGAEWNELSETKPTMFARSLIFVDRRREPHNLNDKDAKSYAMDLTVKDINDYFAEEVEEAMPDEPVSESGKDDGSHESEHATSLPSAS